MPCECTYSFRRWISIFCWREGGEELLISLFLYYINTSLLYIFLNFTAELQLIFSSSSFDLKLLFCTGAEKKCSLSYFRRLGYRISAILVLLLPRTIKLKNEITTKLKKQGRKIMSAIILPSASQS